jgi:hypothetical protein
MITIWIAFLRWRRGLCCLLIAELTVRASVVEHGSRSGRVSLAAPQPCQKPVPVPTYNALFDLYYGTQGPNWKWQNNSVAGLIPWNFTGVKTSEDGAMRPCIDNWQGLVCDQSPDDLRECFVSTVILASHDLAGTLPPSIGNFSGLVQLVLDDNFLSGTLPSSLSSLSELKYLQMDGNLFSGPIPSSLSTLTR